MRKFLLAIFLIIYLAFHLITQEKQENISFKQFELSKIFPIFGRYVPELPDDHFRERLTQNYRIIYYISEINHTIYIQYIFSQKQNADVFFKIHRNEILNFLNQILYHS